MQRHKRFAILLALACVLSGKPAVVYAQNASVQNEVEEAIICLCGCGQTVKNCPHENCGFAIPARTRVTALVNEGKSKADILKIFLDQYGDEILSAPRKEGFNLVGYIMPFAALLAAAGIIFVILRSWAARGVRDEEKVLPKAAADAGSALDRKIEKELEELD